jgi:hypothetical protein
VDDFVLAQYIEGRLSAEHADLVTGYIAQYGSWRQRWVSLKSCEGMAQKQTTNKRVVQRMGAIASAACILLVSGIWFLSPQYSDEYGSGLVFEEAVLSAKSDPAVSLAYQGISSQQWRLFLSSIDAELAADTLLSPDDLPFVKLARGLLLITSECGQTAEAERYLSLLSQRYPNELLKFKPTNSDEWCSLNERLKQYALLAVKITTLPGDQ